jgi:hypothetical protein
MRLQLSVPLQPEVLATKVPEVTCFYGYRTVICGALFVLETYLKLYRSLTIFLTAHGIKLSSRLALACPFLEEFLLNIVLLTVHAAT